MGKFFFGFFGPYKAGPCLNDWLSCTAVGVDNRAVDTRETLKSYDFFNSLITDLIVSEIQFL